MKKKEIVFFFFRIKISYLPFSLTKIKNKNKISPKKKTIDQLEYIQIRQDEEMKLRNVPVLNLQRERQHGDR